ncbi:PP2C family protein-serine/threonine phosphatase [Streptomyces olivochromogenes]|uniref:PP2C family protein-serine/threonine phosphatase n=1 Tax=Streptomyces olivochromogenes TaxID=1963 RepID=UPI001F288ED3|nr:PP2C family protein-serine/threonine phosphatase [Streptomyces olivochromogenes]MCF3133657.1 serine/threonine-protein phosphatase [Streptomyces olivochromogenes]
MLSLRGLTGSRLLLVAVVGMAALLAVGVAVVGLVLNAHHERAARRIETRWRPAIAELGAIHAAAGDLRAAALAAAASQELRKDAQVALGEHLKVLRQLAASADTEVFAKATDLERSATRWLEQARPNAVADGVRVYALPASAAGADPAEGTYAAVDARARTLAALLEQRRGKDVQATSWHMTGVMLYILGLSGALLVTAVVSAVVLQRRYLAPAGALAKNLRRAASGDTSARTPSKGDRGWIGRLTREAEGVRERLALSQRQARRDQEALVQVGPAVKGLHKILATCEDPGPGIVAAGDVRAAEGLIAGDYLGTVPLPDGTTAVFLGDVCGHGVAAGLLAVRLKSVVMVGLRLGVDLDTSVRAVSHALADEEERFTTLAIAVLDPQRSTLTWVNAGHEEPFLRRSDGTVERLEATGPIVHPLLGAPPGTWQTRTTRLGPGDLLVLSTDGLIEGRGNNGEEFGDHRVARILAGLNDPTPSAAISALYTAAEQFAMNWARDDVSLLAAAPAPAMPPLQNLHYDNG